MSHAAPRWTQRIISPEDERFPGYALAPHEAKPTALGLWTRTDLDGRRELDIELIAFELYPWSSNDERKAAIALVEWHVLLLEECGFLTTYAAIGGEWLALCRPLRGDRRGRPPASPPPPDSHAPESSMETVAVERERERARVSGWARERARAERERENAAVAGRWADWTAGHDESSRPARPVRPLLLDAPPIGCSDHPHGRQDSCGPCGTARKQHEIWLASQRYEEQLGEWYAAQDPETEEDTGAEYEPF